MFALFKKRNSYLFLTMLCVVIYALSYVARKAVDSNMNELMDFYSKSESQVGLVSTLFFVCYAVGQVIHGILCKKYNPIFTIFIACVVAAASNLIIGFLPKNAFIFLNVIWAINGFALAMLWPSIILLISKVMTFSQKKTAMFCLSLPVAFGTFLSYGLSSLMSYIGNFKLMFIISASLMGVAAIIWVLIVNKLKNSCLEIKQIEEPELETIKSVDSAEIKKKKSLPKGFILLFVFFAFIAIINNFVKDGISTWTPSFLKQQFSLPNYIAVLLTVVLPLVGMFGGITAVKLYKKTKGLSIILFIFFALALLSQCVIFGLLKGNGWVVILIMLAIITFTMMAINNVTTSIYPLMFSKGVNAGSVAGLIDGFCYVGSAGSAFGLGLIKEAAGWDTVFTVLLVACAVATALIAVVSIVLKTRKKPLF